LFDESLFRPNHRENLHIESREEGEDLVSDLGHIVLRVKGHGRLFPPRVKRGNAIQKRIAKNTFAENRQLMVEDIWIGDEGGANHEVAGNALGSENHLLSSVEER